jgi:membrane protease subunit (stomatin/prohibitin family)
MRRRRGLRRVAGMAAVGGVAHYAGRKSAQAEERGKQVEAQEAQAAPAEAAPQPSDDDKLERLKKLGELRDSGVITEAEFGVEKQKILASL